jgi:HK97 family phage major capsid protein
MSTARGTWREGLQEMTSCPGKGADGASLTRSSKGITMNSIQMDQHFAAFRKKLTVVSTYSKRQEPTLEAIAKTIGTIADSFEQHKGIVQELRGRLDRAETRLARPGAMQTASSDKDGVQIHMPTAQERKAFADLLRTGDSRYAAEARATVNVATPGQGLEAVAPWFDSIVRRMARDATPLLRLVARREVGNFPAKHVVADNRAIGSGWVGENGTRYDTDPPRPLVVEVQPGEWWALPTVTEWALTDIHFDVESWLRTELADQYGASLQNSIVGGDGNNKPTGFLGGPAPTSADDGSRAFGTLQYFASGQASSLPTTTSAVIDLLLTVVHGLKWKYRQKGAWLASALTMSTLRKFKDADGRPILLDSMITGQPATLLGYPFIEVESMPGIAAGSFPLAFGDFEAGYILDEEATGIRVTRDDITSKGFVKFYARTRAGGKVLDSNAIKLVKIAAS